MIEKTKKIIDNNSLLNAELPFEDYRAPAFIYIPTTNSRCATYELTIKEGSKVKAGQTIGTRKGPFFDQFIHSTVSGKFVGLEKHGYKNGKVIDYIKIENDLKDELDSSIKERSEEEISNLSKEEFVEIVKKCSLVGLGGSSFPTYIKLQTKDPIKVLVFNGVECEPFLNADHRLMKEQTNELIQGIKYLLKYFDCHKAIIVYKNIYKDLHDLFEKVLSNETEISAYETKNYYPAGWEVEMIKKATGIVLGHGELPAKKGVVNFNVSTVVSIYNAIKFNKPVLERNLTIRGNGVEKPYNFKIKIGTPINDLLEKYCHVKQDKDKVVIVGGPMMGSSVPTTDIIATNTVTSILIYDKNTYNVEPCVRCGSCVYSCPNNLSPAEIMAAFKANDKDKLLMLAPEKCIECGMCSFTCTSKINVTDWMRKAKRMVNILRKK